MSKTAIIFNSLIAAIIFWGILREGISFQSNIIVNTARIVALSIFCINLLAILKPEKITLIKTALLTNFILIILGMLGLLNATMSNMPGATSLGLIILVACIVPALLNISVLRKELKKFIRQIK